MHLTDMCTAPRIHNLVEMFCRFLRIKFIRSLSIAVLLAACGIAPLFSGKHPVPLDKNMDGAKCLQCHENKTKEKSIHTAVKNGCFSCHAVRVSGDVTRVNLTKTTVLSLCLQCHADKTAAAGQGLLHPPVGQDCTKCHDPHDSPNKDHLQKSLSGDQKENLCLKCHNIGLNVSANGSRHAPLNVGCDTCHVIHKKGTPGNIESNLHLTVAPHTLCLRCHNIKDESLIKAHRGQPFDTADCLTCHAAHQSDGPKLVQKFAHRPYATKMCNVCHQAPKDGKVVLTKTDPKAVCIQCHAETAKKIQNAGVQHAGALGDCLGCHDPHASRNPGYVRPDPVNACLKCHSDQAKLIGSKKVLHKAAFRDGCATCHEPHGGTRPKLLRADINDLCLSCHSADAKPQKVNNQQLISILGGAVRLPENYLDSVPRVTLKSGLGHPVERHPVSDYTDPLDPQKVTKLTCLTCHQAHAGDAKAMLVTNQPPSLSFCSRCHKDFGK
jgi:predicted CXXCH cytochrome family protein